MADISWLVLLAGSSLVVIGFAAAQLFDKYRFPDYFILMALGLLLGSGLLPLGGVDPREAVGTIAPALRSVALAFILFEGGLVLHVRGMGKVWGMSIVHTGVAMALAILGMVLFATSFLGLGLTAAAIIALAFCGPSASIDMSMLSQLKVSDRTRFTIVMEGVMGNVVAAVLVLLLVRVPGATATMSTWTSYIAYLVAAVNVAYGVGRVWVHLVGGPQPRRFSFMTSVALAVGLYAIADGLLGGNGWIAAFVFGLVIGHHGVLKTRKPAHSGAAGERGLQEFHGELVFLLRTFFFLYLGLRVQVTGITILAVVGALAFIGVFYASRWPSTAILTKVWRLPTRDSRILHSTVARGMTDTVLILFAIQVGVIPPAEEALVTNLLFLVILVAALTSALLVFRAERLALREPAPSAGKAKASPGGLPRDLDRAMSEFLADPLVQRGEFD